MYKKIKSYINNNVSEFTYDRLRYLKSDFIYIKRKLFYSDERLIKDFEKRFGYYPNLKKPASFNEKLLAKRINKIGCDYSYYADKYKVRDYVSRTVGSNYLIPLIDRIVDLKDLDISKYNFPIIAKASHASSLNQIIKSPKNFDQNRALFLFNKWIKRDYKNYWGEWYYSDIEPSIVIEKLLYDDKGNVPNDFKFHVFYDDEKEPQIFIQVDIARFTKHERNFYDINWNEIDIEFEYKKSQDKVVMPSNLDEMIEVAKKLSKPFQYSRIDLYDFNGQVYFGEITFIPEAGRGRFNDIKVDKEWGQLLRLK